MQLYPWGLYIAILRPLEVRCQTPTTMTTLIANLTLTHAMDICSQLPSMVYTEAVVIATLRWIGLADPLVGRK